MRHHQHAELNLNYSLIFIGQFVLMSRKGELTPPSLLAPELTGEVKISYKQRLKFTSAVRPGLAGEVFFLI